MGHAALSDLAPSGDGTAITTHHAPRNLCTNCYQTHFSEICLRMPAKKKYENWCDCSYVCLCAYLGDMFVSCGWFISGLVLRERWTQCVCLLGVCVRASYTHLSHTPRLSHGHSAKHPLHAAPMYRSAAVTQACVLEASSPVHTAHTEDNGLQLYPQLWLQPITTPTANEALNEAIIAP